MLLFVLASAALLVLAAWRLNPLAWRSRRWRSLILCGYSYTKRFTWALAICVLGLAISGAPLGAWIAVRGDVAPTPLLLAGAVLLWVAGFDVLYALQDLDFDRRAGLLSIPARFGTVPALWLSALFHAAMLALLALLPRVYPPGLGAWLLARLARLPRPPRLPALDRPAERPLASRRRLLHRQRRPRRLALRGDGCRRRAASLAL